jgi:hypothetical protein
MSPRQPSCYGEGALGEKSDETINLENRHTGEILALRRVKRGDEIWLELKGSLPAHSQGPPMHVHYAENEEGHAYPALFPR